MQRQVSELSLTARSPQEKRTSQSGKKHLLRSIFLLKMTAQFCFLLQRAILDIANRVANGNFSCK